VIDGLLINTKLGKVDWDFVGGITPTRTVDIDSSRPGFDFDTRRGFFGTVLSTQVGQHRPYIYGLVQRDFNQDDPSILGPIVTRFEYNSQYLGVGSQGSLSDRLLYNAEFVYEAGRTLSNSFSVAGAFLNPVPQTRDRIQAFAGDAKLDYLFGDEHNSRVNAEVIFGQRRS